MNGIDFIVIEVPQQYAHRLAPFKAAWGDAADVLGDLLRFKEQPGPLSSRDIDAYHSRLFRLLDKAVQWMMP
jgi:hypothetical protein